jgi:anti-sigma factor (TIGR02949 family)
LSCDPVLVTGFVDGELPADQAAKIAVHLETCSVCRAQADAERELRARLRRLPSAEAPAALESRVRRAARRRPLAARAVTWALPIAAMLLLAVWLRGWAPLVAWDLARDHDHCFSRQPLAAQVSSPEPLAIAAWFRERGTDLPDLPPQMGDLALVGARFCPLASLSTAAHVYYRSASSRLSVFVVPQDVRLDNRFASLARGRSVRLLKLDGQIVGIVAESEADARSFETMLRPALAAELRVRGGKPSWQ